MAGTRQIYSTIRRGSPRRTLPPHRTSWIFSEAYIGWPLDGPKQPVVRVSWDRAMAFSRWLSEKTGEKVTLPTEAQWEYAWGLHDMHGNAAEWTRTAYRPYPYQLNDGRDASSSTERKVVRGGSWRDRPKRCRSAFRLSYPPHQRIYNVGFRVILEEGGEFVQAGASR